VDWQLVPAVVVEQFQLAAISVTEAGSGPQPTTNSTIRDKGRELACIHSNATSTVLQMLWAGCRWQQHMPLHRVSSDAMASIVVAAHACKASGPGYQQPLAGCGNQSLPKKALHSVAQ
jgi:hypothetical protein